MAAAGTLCWPLPSTRSNCGEPLPRVQVHFELEDALFGSTVQRPPVLAHCDACRAHALIRVMSEAAHSPETQAEFVYLARQLASTFVAESFAHLRKLA